MKYYLIEIATGDAKIAGKSVYEYTDVNQAIANFHTKLGNAMKSELYKTALYIVVNENGGVYENHSWQAPVKPEVEETE